MRSEIDMLVAAESPFMTERSDDVAFQPEYHVAPDPHDHAESFAAGELEDLTPRDTLAELIEEAESVSPFGDAATESEFWVAHEWEGVPVAEEEPTGFAAVMERLRLMTEVARGVRDENALTNTLFHARHPELGGRSIRSEERALAQEWIGIRDRIVRPALVQAAVPAGGPSAPAPAPAPVPPPPVPSPPGGIGTNLRSSSWLRAAWSRYRCASREMVPLRILSTTSPVNPLAVEAYRALDRALTATGYVAKRTWSYNCRSIAGSSAPSLHSYGLAVDIDPPCNPHRKGVSGPIRFSPGATQTERCADVRRRVAGTAFTPDQVAAVEAIQTVDGLQIFAWGGRWRSSHDAMHFQINVSPEELARGLAPSPLPIPEIAFDWESGDPSALAEVTGEDEAFIALTGSHQEPALESELEWDAEWNAEQAEEEEEEFGEEFWVEHEMEEPAEEAPSGGSWLETFRIMAAIARGERSENTLTNMIFFSRHPELGGRKIRPEETALVREWIDIRDRMVRRALQTVVPGAPQGGSAPPGPPPPPAPAPAPAPPGPAPAPPPVDLPTEPLGTLVLEAPGRAPFSYRFTAEDALWTAKLIVLEAGGRDDGDNAAVIWAMFNRYALFTHRVFPTFTGFIRAYSTTLQPVLVNPKAAERHMHRADFVRAGGTYPGTSIPRGQLRRHLDVQREPWRSIRSSARSLTLRGLRGELPNPGIGLASEFASTRIFWRQANRTTREPSYDEWRRFTENYAARRRTAARWVGEVAGINQMRNAFFLDLRAASLPPGSVRVLRP